MPLAEVGLMGSIIDTETSFFIRHRFVMMAFLSMFLNAVMTTVRTLLPPVKKVWPMQVKHSTKDIMTIWAGFAFYVWLYTTKANLSEPRFVENFVVANRVVIGLITMVLCHVVYRFVYNNVFSFLPEDNRPQQASNVVRLAVKLVCLVHWGGSGDMARVMLTHPLEMTDDIYQSAHFVKVALSAMYIWELMVRDLRPVNVIHHGITLLGLSSGLEWASVLEPTRTMAAIGMVGALAESVCCLGTMAYRFMPRGPVLKRIMIAETLYVLITFNCSQLYFITMLITYRDIFSRGWFLCFCALVVLTYPAQMNMGKVFWILSKKAGKPDAPKAVAQKPVEPVAAAPIAVRNVSELETAPKSIGELHLRKAVKPEFNIMAGTRQTVSCVA